MNMLTGHQNEIKYFRYECKLLIEVRLIHHKTLILV